jgi:hypothetical protein
MNCPITPALVNLVGSPPNATNTQQSLIDAVIGGPHEVYVDNILVEGSVEGLATPPGGQAYAWFVVTEAAPQATCDALTAILAAAPYA